ncbi:MAG: serine/threonine protein kinase [Nannocystis sp.]|nr:serine/threonine protein kinase [Nannocystis sp.]
MVERDPNERSESTSPAKARRRSFSRTRSRRAESSVQSEQELPLVDADELMVVGVLAEGGVGKILHGYHTVLRRHVAIKQMSGGASPQAELRLLREARLPARLIHPGIIEIIGAGRWPDGEAFYVMRLVEGRSLGQILEQGPSPQEALELARLMISVAEAIGYAHARKIIHRDLKPDNILVSNRGRAIILDWGLAKDLAAVEADEPRCAREDVIVDDPRLTGDGQIMGTPAYMPPEQARGEVVDARADVYAIGAVLYHLITGQAPYAATTASEVLEMVVAGPPRSLASSGARIDARLVRVIEKAMARSPSGRYADGAALAVALRLAFELSIT